MDKVWRENTKLPPAARALLRFRQESTEKQPMALHLLAWLRGLLPGRGPRLEELGVKELATPEELEAALEQSNQAPILLFKHSTTCPISAGAYQRVRDFLEENSDAAPFFLVKVIESRPVSNQIASLLNVQHQSPQLILVDKKQAVWNASHGAIDAEAIRGALQNAS